jgi:hypothetical protein
MIEFLLIVIIILLCPLLQRILGALILFVLAAWHMPRSRQMALRAHR